MSSGALFGNTAVRGASKNLVEFKAGKMTMKGKMVYPDNRRGQLYVYQSDDSLMHFCWKDRTTGVVEDDLIIFPDDCEFKHVSQCKTGRVYLLRFKSSSRKFFFWLQDLRTDKDEEYCRKINEVLNNPPTPGSQRSGGANPEGDLQNLLNNMSQQQLMQLFGGVGQIGSLSSLLGTMNRPFSGNRMSSSSSLSPATTTASRPPASITPSPAVGAATAVAAAAIAATTTTTTTAATTVTETSKSSGNNKSSQPGRTTEPSAPTIDNNRIRLSDLQNFLSGIPSPPGAEPAVQSGQAAPVVQQFGLGPEAVSAATSGNIEQFVSALESEAKAKSSEPAKEQDAATVAEQTTAQQQPKTGGKDKKDDDDEGMALD